jgi:hypothetical protein
MKNWRQMASGLGLLICTMFAMILMAKRQSNFSDRLFCSSLLASFGYLFLSRTASAEPEVETPWWW